jgi:lipoate-protein ligase A
MLCILSKNSDVFFNLAFEEYLLMNFKDDIIMIWRSSPTVVVGKHQNAFAEINHKYVRENKITVARRLTGGGTVFHDEGNLNFTFIKNGEEGKLVDFKKFINPVVNFLATLNIKAEIGLKNDILINNLKISGNAEHVHKSRVLHHGTLLFNSNLGKLGDALKVNSGRYIDKSVQSNRTTVTNISDYLIDKISIDSFEEILFNYLLNQFNGIIFNKLEEIENSEITKLRDEKYSTWDWIYGYSPSFSLERTIQINGKEYRLILKVVKGSITEVDVYVIHAGDIFKTIIEGLKGLKFNYTEISNYLMDSGLASDTIKLLPDILF